VPYEDYEDHDSPCKGPKMSSHQPDEEAIFHIARQLTDPALHATYLDQVCAGDHRLRERVEALLTPTNGTHWLFSSQMA